MVEPTESGPEVLSGVAAVLPLLTLPQALLLDLSRAWLPALAAGAAVLLWLPGPPVRRDRLLASGTSDSSGARSSPLWWAAVLHGRPDARWSVRQRAALGLLAGLALAGAASSWLAGWALLPGLTAALGVYAVLGRLEPTAVRQRRWLLVIQVPQALELLAAGLSAGLPLRAALAGVVDSCPGPAADDLSGVLHLVELGMADVEAWRSLAGHPQLGPVAVDLARSVESGTRLATVLTAHAADARIARRAAIEIQARTVGVRSVLPLMTCFIPAFLLLGVVPTVASALIRAFGQLG